MSAGQSVARLYGVLTRANPPGLSCGSADLSSLALQPSAVRSVPRHSGGLLAPPPSSSFCCTPALAQPPWSAARPDDSLVVSQTVVLRLGSLNLPFFFGTFGTLWSAWENTRSANRSAAEGWARYTVPMIPSWSAKWPSRSFWILRSDVPEIKSVST